MAKSSEPISASFGPLVARVSRDWRRAVDRRLQPHGLTEATWLPLLHLARAPAPLRQNELAASLALDGSSVVRLLDALESARWVERREDGSDRRAKVIVLTAAGRELVAGVEAISREVREHALLGLTDQELATASRVLKHIVERLAQHQGEPEP